MGSLKRPLDRLRIVVSAVVGRTSGPRATLVGAVLMWLGVVIVVVYMRRHPKTTPCGQAKPRQRR